MKVFFEDLQKFQKNKKHVRTKRRSKKDYTRTKKVMQRN